jgi:hypothetical protein
MLTTSRRRALTLVANATYGCTVPYMPSHGCTIAVLRHLARSRRKRFTGGILECAMMNSDTGPAQKSDLSAIGIGAFLARLRPS